MISKPSNKPWKKPKLDPGVLNCLYTQTMEIMHMGHEAIFWKA